MRRLRFIGVGRGAPADGARAPGRFAGVTAVASVRRASRHGCGAGLFSIRRRAANPSGGVVRRPSSVRGARSIGGDWHARCEQIRRMQEGLTILIGASPTLDDVRRRLANRGMAVRSAGPHLRGVRRTLLLAAPESATVVVGLSSATRERYGVELARLISDIRRWPSVRATIGVLEPEFDRELAAEVAATECTDQRPPLHVRLPVIEAPARRSTVMPVRSDVEVHASRFEAREIVPAGSESRRLRAACCLHATGADDTIRVVDVCRGEGHSGDGGAGHAPPFDDTLRHDPPRT